MTSFRIAVALLTLACAAAPVAAQDSKKFSPPKTPWGEPDLQGTYSNRTITPFERPANVNGREFFTKEEVAALESRAQQGGGDEGRTKGSRQDVERAYNDFWWDFGTNAVKTRRTSLVVDPSDGRMPPLTDAAQKRSTERRERGERLAEGPEDRNIGERCILGFNAGPPMLPSAYNNNVQIVQTKDYVLIHNEMVHNARVVPLVSKTTPPRSDPYWTPRV